MENINQAQQNLLEIRGILRTLADNYGQTIATKKRLMELIQFLKTINTLSVDNNAKRGDKIK